MADGSSVFTTTIDDRTGVAEVQMHGSAAGNAMGAAVWTALPRLVASLEGDESVRAVILRGAGDCFSVGLDLLWYVTHYRRLLRRGVESPAFRAALLAEATAMQDAISAIEVSRLPFVAAVHGPCVGVALDLVSACDIRMASREAYFSLREVCLGIVADLGSLQRLPRLIGAGPARELALTGRAMGAEEAYARGLVTTLASDPARLLTEARECAARIAGHAPDAVHGIKQVMEATAGMTVAEGLRHVALWNAAFFPGPDVVARLTAALRDAVAESSAPTAPAAQ